MWILLIGSALAGAPMAVEAGATLSLPHANLGPGPGLRILGELSPQENIFVGIEADARAAGSSSVTLSGPELNGDIDLKTGQSQLALGLRGSYIAGDEEGISYRGGLSLGAARLTQAVHSDAGKSTERLSSLWIRPEGGVLMTLGPGRLTASLYWNLAPANLEILGKGGSTLGLGVGYRIAL